MATSNDLTGLPVFNVKDMGAAGDGVTDDTQVFQDILNFAENEQGVKMYIPNGVYRMTKELIIFSNTVIQTEQNTRIVRDHSGYLLINGYKINQTTYPPSESTEYNGYGNIKIQGGVWDGNGVNQTGKAAIFRFGHSHDLKIEEATFLNVSRSHHIEFNSSRDVHVTNCKFLGYVGTDTLNEAIQLDLSKLGATLLGKDDSTPCKNVWITGCYFGDSGTSGTTHIPRAIGSHSATIGVYHENITIENNVIENAGSFAIRAYVWKNVSITNNKLVNCKAGINWRTNMIGDPLNSHTEDAQGNQTGRSQISENAFISGNVIAGGMDSGRAIEIYGESTGKAKGINVSGNILTLDRSKSINDAILLNYTEDSSVIGNRIYGAKKTGIACRNAWSVTVDANVIDTVGDQGIGVSGSSAYVTIANNNIKRTGKNGIYATAVDTCTITGNTIGGVNGDKNDEIYSHLRLTTNVKRVSITGNNCRNLGTDYKASIALNISSGSNIVRAGNNFAGLDTKGVAGLNDGSDLM